MREIIKNSQLFWKLSEAQIDRVIALCQEEFYEKGSRIFSEGDIARSLCIVKDGSVALEMEVRIGRRSRKQATIDVVTRGQVFGWSALSERAVLTMSAVCAEDTRVIAIDGPRLKRLCDEDADFARKVLNELVDLVSNRLSSTRETLAHVLSVASHDLRAPLATVQSCIDVITGGFVGDVNAKQKELLLGSRQRINDLMNMVDNILDISYLEIKDIDFESTSLYEVVESSAGDVQGRAQEKSIRITNRVSKTLPNVMGMPKRLQQVFTNLLSNAVKFTPVGGLVTVTSKEGDHSVYIEVTDTGIGISVEELPKVFGAFYRGMKVEAEGAGLGLSIAQRIVEAHGGKIWAESPAPETGLGTRFTVSIPTVTPARAKVKEQEVVKRRERILVADDDPELQKVISLVLQSQGYSVTIANDGEEALARIAESKPDLLILDLLMPRMDGFEVCKRLSEQGVGVPVMILSAVREESSRKRYELETRKALGVDDYVEKPISPPLLLQRVEKVLAKYKSKP